MGLWFSLHVSGPSAFSEDTIIWRYCVGRLQVKGRQHFLAGRKLADTWRLAPPQKRRFGQNFEASDGQRNGPRPMACGLKALVREF